MNIVGVIENMSGYKCPKCGEMIELFKKGGGEKAAKELNVEFLGAIPIDEKIVTSCDDGESYVFKYGKTEIGKQFMDIITKIAEKTA